MKKTFGLLGEKLGHSFSPMIHGYLGDYEYHLFEIPADSLDLFMSEKKFDGINVTIPYKQSVIPYCATLSAEAQAIGSVNTIVKDRLGALHGHNTDYHGFSMMLERGKVDPSEKKVLVLGDGGAAKTVRAVIRNMGARELVTISRRGECNYENVFRHYDAEIIVNTTPVGMYPDNGNTPVSLSEFRHLECVAELIYNPMRTKLMLDAQRNGLSCVNGLVMLAAQAEMASRLFLDISARPELVDLICMKILYNTRNVALIGMPGCGKSTVGKLLAEMMGRRFIDIDSLIERVAGKRIPEIFKEGGESSFRDLETRVVSDEAKKSGVVIATGGGVVTRPENLDLLRQNSLIVYLDRELSELSIGGRPLSEKMGVNALAQQRRHLYESWCDCTISVDADAKQIAERILENLKPD